MPPIVLTCTCSRCKKQESYELDEKEKNILTEYQQKGRSMGSLSQLFPDIPDWILYGTIDPMANEKTICQNCQDEIKKLKRL